MASFLDGYGIHWFRRDLRVAGNPALQHNWKEHQGRVLGLFFFDAKFLSRPDFSHNRFALFLESLRELQKEMRELGGDLVVVDGQVTEELPRLLGSLRRAPTLVSFNRDYEPYARERDQAVTKMLAHAGLRVRHERDHLLLEPHETLKDDGSSYQIYSPFGRKWFDLLQTEEVRGRLQAQKKGLEHLRARAQGDELAPIFKLRWSEVQKDSFPYPDALERFIEHNRPHVTVPIPAAGARAAFQQLQDFKHKIQNYAEDRDRPDLAGTSRLSMYLKNGSITTAQIIAELDLARETFKSERPESKFLKELAWREFYYSILWHEPRVEHEAFNVKFKDLAWENNEDWFDRWRTGRTGFPIVDAGMRELQTTGWMHNRVRMIVASFLCKDLLIDWRWGERHFMHALLDGDLAPNNGGWQWAASTGCDPQPYFRIFNPWLQSAKFDPEGHYIRKFVPELARVSSKDLHREDGSRPSPYPAPMLDHAAQKKKALQLYSQG